MIAADRHDAILRLAYDLAASGLHIEPLTIIPALLAQGYSEAAEVLGNALVRAELREICLRNWPGAKAVNSHSVEPQGEAATESLSGHAQGGDG